VRINCNCGIFQRDMKTSSSLRKILSVTTKVTVLLVVTIIMLSAVVFSSAATAPVAFGERMMIDSQQSVTVTTATNGIDQNSSIDRHTSSLRITQSPENGLNVECGGNLKCEILDNNTVVATTDIGDNNTTNMTMITSALNELNQSLTQMFNQSSIPLPPLLSPFGDDNFFDDMLNDDFDVFKGQEDLDSGIDELIDRMLNETLGDLPVAPLQTPPSLKYASVEKIYN